MSLARFSPRRDENEPEVVAALKGIGAAVQKLSHPGVPDLLVYFQGLYFLIEVIGEAKFRKNRERGGLTPIQADFHRAWPGLVIVARSGDEAVRALRAVRENLRCQ